MKRHTGLRSVSAKRRKQLDNAQSSPRSTLAARSPMKRKLYLVAREEDPTTPLPPVTFGGAVHRPRRSA